MHFSFLVNCFYFMWVLFHLSSSVHFWVVSRIETAAGDSAIPRFLRFLYICWKVVIRLQCKIPIEENSVFWKTFFLSWVVSYVAQLTNQESSQTLRRSSSEPTSRSQHFNLQRQKIAYASHIGNKKYSVMYASRAATASSSMKDRARYAQLQNTRSMADV